MTRLWDKGAPLDEAVLRFTVGDDFVLDERLVAYDIRASIAHAEMLAAAGHLDPEDLARVRTALTAIGEAHERGEWTISRDDEDVHTALENRLVEAVGEPGKRIHLGRSRNDQVLAALRLYLKDAVASLLDSGKGVLASLEEMETGHGDIPLPGYTHGQRAMPSSVALWAGGFRAELEDDLLGVAGSLRRIDRNPLGSGAGFGVPVLDVDREATRRSLGFAEVHEPVTAVQLSRGKAEAGLVFELCLWTQDLGRLASDVCLFATSEFAFVSLHESITTGSSMMPQKRNPDVFELVRARSAQLPSELLAILGVTAKMTSGYHRDLQLIKAPLFRSIDLALEMSAVMARVLPLVQFDAKRCAEAMDPSLYATEKAIRRTVEEKVAFREAYRGRG